MLFGDLFSSRRQQRTISAHVNFRCRRPRLETLMLRKVEIASRPRPPIGERLSPETVSQEKINSGTEEPTISDWLCGKPSQVMCDGNAEVIRSEADRSLG